MTWGEFKQKIEGEGAKDSDTIDYFDCNFQISNTFTVDRHEVEDGIFVLSVYD
jgi:hypothetical protein